MRFEACAQSYDTYAAPQRAFAAKVAEFAQLSTNEQIMELGAGTGALTKHLCALAAGVHATDVSPSMVALGHTAAPSASWSLLDAFTEPVPAASLQISSGLLQWAPDPVRVLQQWKSALLPGGRMVHAFPCEPCLAEWRALVPESPVVWRNESAWRTLFAQAGLMVQRSALWVQELTFASSLDMLRAMHRSGVTGRARLGPGQLRQALHAYDLRYKSPAGVTSTWVWLALEARAQ